MRMSSNGGPVENRKAKPTLQVALQMEIIYGTCMYTHSCVCINLGLIFQWRKIHKSLPRPR